MTDRKQLRREYKDTIQPMGVFQIRNLINGKIFIGSSLNLRAVKNRFEFQPDIGWHISSDLKNDFMKYGNDNFILEVIDELEPGNDPSVDYRDDLAELEQIWIDKLQPFGEKGYNKRKNE